IDLNYIDLAIRPPDDFFRYVSGIWLDTVQIPADRARYGAFDALRDLAEQRLRVIIDDLSRSQDLPAGSDARRIADLYNSFMNDARAEAQGLKPLQSELARID